MQPRKFTNPKNRTKTSALKDRSRPQKLIIDTIWIVGGAAILLILGLLVKVGSIYDKWKWKRRGFTV